jgi:hypothetical protein
VKGKQVLDRVTFQQNAIAVQVEKRSNLTLTDGTIAPDGGSISSTGVVVEGQARFAWRGGSLLSDPRVCHAGETGVFAGGHAQVTLQAIAVRDGALRLIDLQRSARATVTATELHSSGGPDGCSPDSTLLARDQSRLTLDGVTLTEDHGAGTAITSASDPGVVVRHTSISGFAFGVVVAGVRADLGRSGDPGANTFRSAVAGVTYIAALPGTLQAVGNTWRSSTQGADAAGHYADGTTVASDDALAHGPNFDLQAPEAAIVL